MQCYWFFFDYFGVWGCVMVCLVWGDDVYVVFLLDEVGGEVFGELCGVVDVGSECVVVDQNCEWVVCGFGGGVV